MHAIAINGNVVIWYSIQVEFYVLLVYNHSPALVIDIY